MIARIALPETLRSDTLDRLEYEISTVKGSALVLEGTCRGMDLESFVDSDAAPQLSHYAGLLRAIRAAACPTIAALDGAMIGGGLGVAASCDVVLATSRTTFALPEALFGLFPGVVVPSLLHRVSPHTVHLLALLGTSKNAEWARTAGLVDEISDDLEQATTRWVRALGRVDKRRVVELRDWTCNAYGADALEQGARRSARAVSEPWVRELTRAFLRDGEAPWLR